MSAYDTLAEEVATFIMFAESNPDHIFLLTPTGSGTAGFTHEQVAPLFDSAPANVILPVPFADVLHR